MRRSFLAGLMALVLSVTVARAQDTAPPAAHTLMHATVAAVVVAVLILGLNAFLLGRLLLG